MRSVPPQELGPKRSGFWWLRAESKARADTGTAHQATSGLSEWDQRAGVSQRDAWGPGPCSCRAGVLGGLPSGAGAAAGQTPLTPTHGPSSAGRPASPLAGQKAQVNKCVLRGTFFPSY